MSAGQKSGRLSRADAPRDTSLQSTGAKLPVNTCAPEGTSGPADAAGAIANNNRRSFTTFVRVAVALLLLTSAGFKTYAIFTEPYFADSILGSPLWMVGLVECEILLGLWLLSGVALRLAWYVALIAFIGFAGVNIYLLATGATTCGCFGTVETHPWVMLGIDLAVLAALVIARSNLSSRFSTSGIFRHSAFIGGFSAVLLGLIAAWLVVQYGSINEGIAAWRGESISLSPSTSKVGQRTHSSAEVIKLDVTNRTDSPVTILGAQTSCKCVAVTDLPITIPPKSSTPVEVLVRFVGEEGPFRQHVKLFTDSPRQPHLVGRVTGTIVMDSQILQEKGS